MRVTESAHEFLRPALCLGTHHLDATCGNGHDTAFLLRYSPPCHRVIAMDLQKMAIVATRERIAATGESTRLLTICEDHANLERHLGPQWELGAAVFNLGYLPGGDNSIITSPESTLAALQAVKTYLAPGGRLAVVVYPDHPGGREEAEAVDSWFDAIGGQREVRPNRGPYLCQLVIPGTEKAD